MTAIQVVDYLMNAYIDIPVSEWGTVLEEADFPNIAICMSGTFCTILTLIFPEEVVNYLVPTLIDIFGWM